MLEREKLVFSHFDSCSIESGGEVFIPFSKLSYFIGVCQGYYAVVYSVELVNIKNGKVVPYFELMSFDASQLFDDSEEWEVNMRLCNNFILDCYKKFTGDTMYLYFNAVIEFSEG